MACPSCGAVSDPGARFCASCGAPLASVGDERRVVTVLFADLVGYTTLAERLDPELVKNRIDRLFQRLVADITECGGQVDKIVGDAIVALFGAPVAHEDDAERAVRAALRMQQTLEALATRSSIGPGGAGGVASTVGDEESSARMRIGVNTGEVLVGALRAGGSITAMGDVVNTASRLQTSARPGEVLVGPATHAATRNIIRYEPRGMLAAKGRDERVEAWSAVEALLPPGYRPSRRTVPLVGRASEMAVLRNVVESGVANNRAVLTMLVGDAGVGKTRLAGELAAWVAEEYGALVNEGRCVPYGEANVWWPIAEALRRACYVDSSAGSAEACERTRDRVAQALDLPIDADAVERVANGLLFLMGEETPLHQIDPAKARDEAVRSVTVFVDRATRIQPVVLQLSDLHWADQVVLDLLDTLLDRLSRRPFVLIATARQDIRECWSPRAGRFNLLSVNLDPLDAEATADLLDSLLDVPPSPALRKELIERSGGNPFFLEELVALLGEHETDVEDASTTRSAPDKDDGVAQVPDTLRGLVAARLDALSPDERAVLADGAVLGRRGRLEHLRRLSHEMGRKIDVDAIVIELVGKELFEFADGRWEFRSDLVREVAYSTITKLDRAKRHVGIADWVEAHHSGSWSDDAVDRMAYHYGAGAELIDGVGTAVDDPERVREKALLWIGRAAESAHRQDLAAVAARRYSQALDLAGPEPTEQRITFLLGRSQARGDAWDLAESRLDAEAAIAESETIGFEAGGARGLLALGDVVQKSGDTDGGLTMLRAAAERFAALGDDKGRGEALRLEGMAELFRGALVEAEVAVRAALEAFRAVGSSSNEAWALQNLAWISFSTGRTDEAEDRLNRSLATFLEIGDEVGRAWATGLMAFVKFHQGDRATAEKLASTVLLEAQDRGDRWPTAMMFVLLAQLDLWSGRTESAAEQAASAAAIFDEIGDSYGRAQAGVPLARALMMLGHVEDGLASLDAAMGTAMSMPGRESTLLAEIAIAAARVQLGDPHGAMVLLGLAETSVEPDTLAGSEILVIRALALLQLKRVHEAEQTLQPEGVDADAIDDRPLTGCVLALVAAASGRVADSVRWAESVPHHPAATYLDVATASVAAGLALARSGDASAARRWLTAAREQVDATQDRLGQAVIRVGQAIALEAVGAPDAAEVRAEAEALLARLGIDAEGWATAFSLAVGADPAASR